MSVLNEVRDLEGRITARLNELRPLVEEYEALQRVAERLGVDARAPRRSQIAATATRRGATKSRSSTSRSRKRPAGRGASSRRRVGGTQATGRERRERVLALIGEQPGITVSDISARLGVDAPPLYRVVRKLQGEGLIEKRGKQLQLVSS